MSPAGETPAVHSGGIHVSTHKVMERIVTQSIPKVVIHNPFVDWNPYTNQVQKAAVQDADSSAPADMQSSNEPEKNRRYQKLLNNFLPPAKHMTFISSMPKSA